MASTIAPTTLAPGIYQGGTIVRTALVAALQDLRDNPEFLEFAFASLVQDSLTQEQYGDKVLEQAIEWFLAAEVAVVTAPGMNDAKMPCIVVELTEGLPDNETLGDVHWTPSENFDKYWIKVVGPLTPVAMGFKTLTFLNFGGKTVTKGMEIVTSTGVKIPILDVNGFVLTVDAANMANDFSNLSIYPTRPSHKVKLESIRSKETYKLGVHVQGEPQHLTYLWSILMFCLFRYKSALFEHRGFDNVQVRYGAPFVNPVFGQEIVYSQDVYLSGVVCHYWPKSVGSKLLAVTAQPDVIGQTLNPADPPEEPWLGDGDTNEEFEDDTNTTKTIRFLSD